MRLTLNFNKITSYLTKLLLPEITKRKSTSITASKANIDFATEIMEKTRPENRIFTLEELASLDFNRIPQHIAIIPDGNRRWAMQNGLKAAFGHQKGADIIMNIIKGAKQIGVKTLTLYIFSTENWTRPQVEIDALLLLLDKYLNNHRQPMIDNNVKLHTIGNISRMPPHIIANIEKTKAATALGTDIDVVLALNYGARDEIRRAVGSLMADFSTNKIKKEDITESLISKYLDTTSWPDPEMLIRTSGEYRISNFLLWQMSYTELYITPVLWPDFTPHHFLQAVQHFQRRERRVGA